MDLAVVAFSHLERYVVGHRPSVVPCPARFFVTFAVPLGIEELNPIRIDEVSVVLCARLLVIPRFCSLTAFYVNAGTFVKAVADDLRLATKGFHGEPFRVFLQLAVFTPRPS